jgi:hypothetical protein
MKKLIKKIKYGLVIALLFNLSCGKIGMILHKECTTLSPYLFRLPVTYFPNKYVFSIGDTIKVNYEFSDELKDHSENKIYLLEDYKQFYPEMRLIKMDSTSSNPFFFEFSDTCDVKLKDKYILHDRSYSQDAGISFNFEYNEETYTASISFILKQKGIYYFKHSSAAIPEFPGNFEGRCKTRLVEINIFHDYDTNFDLVKWLLYPNADPRLLEHNDAEGRFRNIGGYAFEVK